MPSSLPVYITEYKFSCFLCIISIIDYLLNRFINYFEITHLFVVQNHHFLVLSFYKL